MANYQAGDKLVPAMQSVLRQSVADLELIVCDDASGDDSVAIAERFMRDDPRISLIRADANGGPARSRNRGLEVARGQWIAIVDSDDIIHPERFERLLAAANYADADIIADDLLHFYEDGAQATLLLRAGQDTLFSVDAAQWVGAGFDGSAPLGYLKPMIRAEVLADLRYDESLRIGEDYDLVLRLLLAGASMSILPEPYYLYRRHSGSISHRLSVADLEAMLISQTVMRAWLGNVPEELAQSFDRRQEQLGNGLAFEELVAAVKGRRLVQVASLLVREPRLGQRLWQSFSEGRRRKAQAPRVQQSPVAVTLGPSGRGVPDYVPVDAEDWTAPRQRQAWLELADLGHGQPIDVICLDDASRHAAGFIPLVRIREAVAQAEAELVK
ncbi:MAG: Beta,3-glucosyltransferase [Devosia sp.]|nr:Beta,3-glucosyltransferase [Devosia sp.]